MIDARTDTHVWAETYDRTAADLFAIQSELAQSIVSQLKAKLSPQQKAEIEERPTQDLVSFELYLQAKQIVDSYLIADDVRAALLKALQLLQEAIKRDENFVSAYCYAARANDLLYFFDLDPTRTGFLAETAINTALRLRDELKPILQKPIFFFVVIGIMTARWPNWPSRARICLIARRFLFSTATSIRITIGLKRSAISLLRSLSTREIRMLTICWLIHTTYNGGTF